MENLKQKAQEKLDKIVEDKKIDAITNELSRIENLKLEIKRAEERIEEIEKNPMKPYFYSEGDSCAFPSNKR